jgi:plastocyanin
METSNTTQPTQNQSSFNPMIIVAIVAIVAIAGIAYMMSRKDAPESANTIQQEQVTQAPQEDSTAMDATEPSPEGTMEKKPADGTAMEESTDVKTINVDAGAFYYKPAEIRVKKGEKDMMHDFVIDELGVKLPITKSGETKSVEFTPEKTGTFEYYCSVGQHRVQGQVGKIIVE